MLQTGRYKNRMYAGPLNTGSQLLWYRKDLVPNPPTTWDEMIKMADALPAGKNFIEVQGARYEGLSVWFNSLLESAGGRILTKWARCPWRGRRRRRPCRSCATSRLEGG